MLDPSTGFAPVGRFPTTLDDLKAAFVDDASYSSSTSRKDIWTHFEDGLAQLRSILPIAYVWVGGSFTSTKMDPDDIDLVFWAEDRHINAVTDPADALILAMFAQNAVRANTGLRLDCRVCHWHVQPATGLQPTQEHQIYVTQRGFWDDFWMRHRSGIKGAPPTRPDAIPYRGYFEVELEGLGVI